MAIGCDRYESLNELSGAEQDANNIFNALVDKDLGNYDSSLSLLLLSPALSEVETNLDHILFDIGPLDTFTFFFAGHGGVKSGSYYLCLRNSRFDRLSASALGISALFTRLNEAPPRQTNIILDACFGGGVIADIGALLKPELIGGAETPGITIFASTASNEEAGDTPHGGPGTLELLNYIRGAQVADTTSEYLDLASIGRLASASLKKKSDQSPVVWGLNLHGEAKFSRNPHYNTTHSMPAVFFAPFDPTATTSQIIRAHGDEIWGEFLRGAGDFSPARFRTSLMPVMKGLSDRLRKAWSDAAGGDSSSGCGPERPAAGWPSLAGRRSATRPT